MNIQALTATASAMVAGGKGLLAMDESNGTCNERFPSTGIPQTVEMRRAWRELLLVSPGLGDCISGVILYDETIRQAKPDGTPFVKLARDAGVLVGIKVDTGARALATHPDETVTEGLDGLRERLQGYVEMGARFAKWRGVLAIDDLRLPTTACTSANAHALARYAALCQEAGMVPIMEPEVLMEGTHTLARCQEVTEAVLRSVVDQLVLQGVVLEATILKPNMVIAGLDCTARNAAEEVADATLKPAARRACRGARHHVPVGWTVRRRGQQQAQRHARRTRAPVVAVVLVRTGPSASGPGHLGWQGRMPRSSAAGVDASRAVQRRSPEG